MELNLRAVEPGTRVYSSDDEHVGDVEEVESTYLRVHTGWFFGKTRYIPFAAIVRVESDGVFLTVAKAEVDAMGWDAPPAETAGAHAVAAGTGAQHTTGAELYGDSATPLSRTNEVTPPAKQRDAAVSSEQPTGEAGVESTGLVAFQEGTLEVRARHEELIVGKRTRVVEEIVLTTTGIERTETVHDTVRRTRVDIAEVAGQTTTGAATASTAPLLESTAEVAERTTVNTRKRGGKRGRQ